jgi:drug/metabolite transporter (DMT)-like permease
VALAYAATLILFILANKLTTAANSIFLQAVAPLYLLLLGPWLLKEPVGRADIVFLAAFAAGLALFFVRIEPPRQTAPDPFLGNILAAISGATWALVLVGLRWLGREGRPERGSPAASVAFGNLIAFAVCLPWTFPMGQIQIRDWLILVYLGVFQVGLAYVCVTLAMRRLGALEASLLILIEPALNPIWAWLVHGEKPGALALTGGGVILVATAFRVLWRPRKPAWTTP